ncbi:hypothetical protein WOC76_22335 [Methylocystis sp. IM3]|uniref:hypothetical protein n=1 Tax=Methylocystis sp. IM3 TaxID=3136722 RepID=UPI003119A76A
MTCEIAVMNKRGVALAADSAVSIGDGHRVYHTAEKLFRLSNAPIAIMTYGCSEMMGVPWEIVINTYIEQFGPRRFSTVEQYAQDFLRFVEASEMLFPASAQEEWFLNIVESVWRANIREPWLKKLGGEKKPPSPKASSLLLLTVKAEAARFQKVPQIEHFGDDLGEKIFADYDEGLRKLEDTVYPDVDLTDEIREGLRLVAKLMHTRQWFHPNHFSGMVVAGYGDAEPFPSLYIYSVGTIVSSKLRWIKNDEAHVDRAHPVIVIPFAQTDMIDLFCNGIYPTLKDRLAEIISKSMQLQKATKSSKLESQIMANDIRKIIEREFQEKYTVPLIGAVEALSRYDLAKMAEALVSLTAFKARMSVEQQEAVGGPIDVAVISKGQGFAWVKRKSPIEHDNAVTGFLIS